MDGGGWCCVGVNKVEFGVWDEWGCMGCMGVYRGEWGCMRCMGVYGGV